MVVQFRITPMAFVEIFIGIVTLVWGTSFIIGIIDPHFDTSPYNNIFMVVAGSGVFAAAFTQRLGGYSNDPGDKS